MKLEKETITTEKEVLQISKEEFIDACADVAASLTQKIGKGTDLSILLLATFSAAMTAKLFDKKEIH